MKKLHVYAASLLIAGLAHASLIAYETAVSSPADGGAGPALWFKNATTQSGEHILNSGSAGATSSTHQAFRLGGTLYEDLWGNANMAFGPTNATAPAVSGSSGLFATGAKGTVSFLFKTPDAMPGSAVSLFGQGASFTVALNGPSSAVRIAHANSGTKFSNVVSVATGTWYYFAMTWDTDKSGNDLTWYLGAANGSLQSGSLTIERAGENTSIALDTLKAPMQQVAVWERELSDTSIQQQFSAIPEPATVGLFAIASLGLMILRRRIML